VAKPRHQIAVVTMKRAKPFPAMNASRKLLEADGWTVAVVEHHIPHTFIKRDLFGFADLLAVSPARGIMAVQVTGGRSTSNANARIAKIRSEPRAGIWLASGGRIAVHSWQGGKRRECVITHITPHDQK